MVHGKMADLFIVYYNPLGNSNYLCYNILYDSPYSKLFEAIYSYFQLILLLCYFMSFDLKCVEYNQ